MGQTLKVLNAVRHHEIGIPLTLSQFVFAYAEEYFELTSTLDIYMRRLHTWFID